MKIDIIISADDIKEEKIKDKSIVVIDILRATSVIIMLTLIMDVKK